MNLNKLDNSASDSDSSHLTGRQPQQIHHQNSIQEAPGLPSAPLDPEWVSPFTLPPLPALRKKRNRSKLLRTPEEQLHQRTSSSAYYAAAWGSPYATPSPSKSPATRNLRRRSQDFEVSSPLSSRVQEFRANVEEDTQGGLADSFTPRSAQKRANSWDKSTTLSERFNWLSESDLSDGEPGTRAGKTPTKDTYVKSLKASLDKVPAPRSYSHQVQDSVATITPETFNAVSDTSTMNTTEVASAASIEGAVHDKAVVLQQQDGCEKPLPHLPPLNTHESKADLMTQTASPDSPTRPRMMSTQSYQRPRRKVPWKGKTCVIALPLIDRDSAGLPSLLTSDEIKARLRKWVAEGYDVDRLTSGGPQDISSGFGQSRPLFPDPYDMNAERKDGKLHVHVPDQDEWDAWVEYLKEERLRALGVTPSNSEPPMSVQSPFSSTLSRVSSTYPSLAASPPISTISANGNPLRIAGNLFSPPLGHQGSMSSHHGSHVVSPSISGYHGPLHGYKQSIAHPRMTSPYDYPISHPGSFSAGVRNNSSALGMRQFSPPSAANLQSLGQILAPEVPIIPSNDGRRGTPQNPTMEQIRQQQQRQQQLHQIMIQHQRHNSYFPPPQSKSADQLPRTPVMESPNRKTPEIMHPTPRTHRHNLSAALQRGVDDAEARLTWPVTVEQDGRSKLDKILLADKEVEAATDEDAEPELPVLKRPVALPDNDDQSEIETNPSLAASPMLMNEQNPFGSPLAHLRQIKEVLQPQSQHKPQPSMSRLNVKAPEFNPQTSFSGAVFSFGAHPFQSATTSGQQSLETGTRPTVAPKNLSLSKLNIDAPAFTPSFVLQSTPAKYSTADKDTPDKQTTATPSKSSFTFSSPVFNVDAPEFKPSQSLLTAARVPEDEPSNNIMESIFGNITIDANSKVTRRGTKPGLASRPRADETGPAEQDDERGRPKAPSDRLKRARRVGGDDNDELLFASSAPFDSAEGLSFEKKITAKLPVRDSLASGVADHDKEAEVDIRSVTEIQHQKSANHNAHDNVQTEPDTSLSHEQIAPQSENQSAIATEQGRAFTSPEPTSSSIPLKSLTGDKPMTHDERPNDHSTQEDEKSDPQSLIIEDLRPQGSGEQAKSSLRDLQINHKPTFSLSALAQPFEFRPDAAVFSTPRDAPSSQPTQEPTKQRGLMASRYAHVSPEPEPVDVNTDDDPSSHKLYEYIASEDAEFDRTAMSRQSSRKATRSPPPFHLQPEGTPQSVQCIDDSMQSEEQTRASSRSSSHASKVEDPMPSYEEIDAVMKQFENNPDLGVEREDTPRKSTPSIDMRLAPVFRSDAPSPSPRRRIVSPDRRAEWGLGIHKLNSGNEPVSDWNGEFSPRQVDKLQSHAQYFDTRVNDLVDSILGNRLGPLEQALHMVEASLITLVNQKPQRDTRRSWSAENKEDSNADDADDADDEDEQDIGGGLSSYRSRSPSRQQRKNDKIKTIVMDVLAAQKSYASEHSHTDMAEIRVALEEMRCLAQIDSKARGLNHPDTRAILEDVISNHAQFKAINQVNDHQAVQETYRFRIDALQSSLEEARRHADDERALRQEATHDVKRLTKDLFNAQEQIVLHREASEEARSKLDELEKDQEAYLALQSKHDDILESNRALEDTLAEYRVTSDQFRDDIKVERARNEDLIRRMHNLREDFNDKVESRRALRNQMEHLQNKMVQVMDDVHAEEAEWRDKEHELVVQNKTMQAALDHEIRHRGKAELELDVLSKEYKEILRFKIQHEHAEKEITRLQERVTLLSKENKTHQDKCFQLERDLIHSTDSTKDAVSQATARVHLELDAVKAAYESLQSNSDGQISRLQKRLDDAELDLEDQKAKHDTTIAETTDSHAHALHEANQKRESALEELHSSHERKLNDLRERHTRALHNSSDDRRRLEHHLNEKLAIGEERTKHLEGQLRDLEERLEITKSAARAAVEAATAKAINVPTPAPSVVSSPPQKLSSASLQMLKGTDLPEKISPRAMRESIVVLQEQLQNREHTIEQLEARIATFDQDAPAKLKERDTEIVLLRELLSVRVDDLNEIIATISQPDYDRAATKNAAIRLKANLQMEQQLKERAALISPITSSLPSLSSLSNLASSPRGLPMAAAAAFGNWRKARDFSFNAVSDIAANIVQTPSKSNVSSPSSIRAGIMTPLSTLQRTPPANEDNSPSPSTTRPLAAAAAVRRNAGGATEARPLRAFSSQPRTLSSRQVERRRESSESVSSEASKKQFEVRPETPTTPLANKSMNTIDLGDDVDDDASPLDTSHHHQYKLENAAQEAVALIGSS